LGGAWGMTQQVVVIFLRTSAVVLLYEADS
jgi:hypothetical protein